MTRSILVFCSNLSEVRGRIRLSRLLLAARLMLMPCLLWLAGVSSAQDINTIVGGGTPGGAARTAFIGYPGGVVRDSAGNTYISSGSDHYVYKLTSSGSLTVFAGVGYEAFNGDGGPATSAALNIPAGMAIDASGNFYIADSGNNRIRCVIGTVGGCGDSQHKYPVGTILTVAGSSTPNMFLQGGYGGDGGPATSALLNIPYTVAINSQGNLLISDYGNFRIRSVNLTTGIITTVAGNGTPGFSGDGQQATGAEIYYAITVLADTSGGFYIADSGNNRIRHVNGTTQVIETVAGSSNGGFSGDGGPPVDAELSFPNAVVQDAGGNLYIIDTGNSRVRWVGTVGKEQIISTVVGTGVAGFAGDGGPALKAEISDSSGAYFDNNLQELLIADSGTQRLRVVRSKDIINTLAGGGNAGNGGPAKKALLSYPVAIALDSSGNMFIAQASTPLIWKVSSNGTIKVVAGTGVEGFSGDEGPATQADFYCVSGVAVDSAGNLFISDTCNQRVRRVDHATHIVSTFAGNGSACTTAPCGDGGLATNASLSGPASLAVDSAGNVYVADVNDMVIRKVNATTGVIEAVAGDYTYCTVSGCGDGGPATQAQLTFPYGVAVDATGNIFIADSGDNKIRRVDATTGDISTVALNGDYGFGGVGGLALNASMAQPLNVAVDATDDIFISGGYYTNELGGGDEVVCRVDAVTQIITTVAGQDTNPTLYGFAGDGGPATSALLNNLGIAVDGAGNLYIADAGNNRVRKVAP
jgi:hypothetical protein